MWRTLAAGLAALIVLPACAQAATKMYSYNSADAETRARVDDGLTLVFDKGLLGMNVTAVLATQAHAEADLRPADERDLKVRLPDILPKGAGERALYSVEDKEQGLAMIRALCPGSTQGWLVFSPLRPRTDAVIHVLGEDKESGKARYCTTLNLAFRGEWPMPGARIQPQRVAPLGGGGL